MWIVPSRDKTLAELAAAESIRGGPAIQQWMVQPPRNQWMDAVNQIAPAVKDYIQKKKSDEIANQLLGLEQSPFAGSGAEGVKYQQLYQNYQDSQPDTATDDLNYLKLWQQTHPDEMQQDEPPLPQRGPGYVDTPYGRMTAQQWADYQRKMGGTPIARGRLDDKGEFTNQYTGAENGPQVQVRTYDGKIRVMPWDDYQRLHPQVPQNPAAQAYQEAQNQAQLPAPDLPPVTQSDSTPAIASQAEYDALPSGSVYIAPDGKKHRKP